MSGEPEYYRLLDSRGKTLADRVEMASGFIGRLRGLAGRRSLEPGTGLWLRSCNGIHTFGMRFPIDVLALDRENRILAINPSMPPNRILFPLRGGFSVIE